MSFKMNAFARGTLLLLAGAAAVVGGASCTLISGGDTVQCSSDADCDALEPGTVCQESVCVSPDAGTGGAPPTTTTTSSTGEGGTVDTGCVSNKQCADDNGQLPFMCRTPGEECASLLSEDCTRVFGDFTDENAIVFGMMAPLTQFDFVALDYFVTSELATSEFEQFLAGGGLPGGPGGASRPIVVVVCDELEDPQRAARHLVDVVKVPAMSGPGYSEKVLEIATEITIPNDVLILSPSASSPLLANLPDNGLVMSSLPNAISLVDGVIPLVEDVESKVREARAIAPEDDIKLALTVAGDSLDLSIGNPVSSRLIINGRSTSDNPDTFRRFDYDDPTTDEVDFSSLVSQLISFRPEIIVNVGQIELYDALIPLIEDNWPDAAPRPEYVLMAGQLPLLAEYIASVDDPEELRARIRGVRNTTPKNPENYDSFIIRYKGLAPEDAPIGPYTGNIYDSLYMLVYGTMALGSVANSNITGTTLAAGILQLNPPGTRINVGPDSLQQGVNLLTADPTGMDFVGAGGEVDIDPVIGSPKGGSEVWCVDQESNFIFAGQSYNVETGELDGEYLCEPAPE